MYHQDDELIKRAVAGAHDDIILSQREMIDKQELDFAKDTENAMSEMGMSKDLSEITGKDKKKQRKKKRKQIKKYIKSGRLPENYDELPKDEKDRLYLEIRQKIDNDNLEKEGLNKINEEKAKEDDFEISTNEIGLGDSTKNATIDDSQAKESETHNGKDEESKDVKVEKEMKKPKSKPKNYRHSSAPRNNNDDDINDEDDEKEIEKLKQLISDGMDETPSKPNIPKLNTNLLKDQDKYNEKVTKRGPKIDEDVNLAIVDMGNGCWTHHHFTSQIQTRQYRSPETIIGVPYGPSADIWSLACMVFELLTGDFLFEPRKGHYYDKDDDHLAQMVELLGPMPKNFALSGKNSRRFFDSTGHLRRIRGLNYWPLHRVLTEKYRFREEESKSLSDFLLCMLTWYPDKRATAQEMLEHPWLKMPKNDDYRMNDGEYEEMMAKIKNKEEAEK